MSLRIGIHTQYYLPEMGAPQGRLSHLAGRMAGRGHEVHVLTAMPNYPTGKVHAGYGGLTTEEEIGGARVVRSWIRPSKRTALLPRLASYFSFAASSLAVGAARLPRLDFLLTESPPLFLGPTGYLLSRLKGARWIFNVSDLWPASALVLGVIDEGPMYRLALELERLCYERAWLVTGQSREILEDIEGRYPDVNTHHLSNGVDTTVFRPGLCHSATRRRLGNPDGTVAIYAGLHGVAQGLDQVLHAAELLRDEEAITIAFVGDGPEKERLVKLSRSMDLPNVRFLPPVPREEMPEIVASADAAVVPLIHSIPGAVPSKLYETMGAGVPVILAAEGEAADIVRETGAGVVIRPGDAEALAEALRELAPRKDLAATYGKSGRRAAEERYDRDDIADTFIDVLEHEHANADR